jgi:hypothetical protein
VDGKVFYEGGFKNDKRDGHGKMTGSDGKVLYEGEYKDGKMHGHGTVTRADGKVFYEGEWKNGKMHGQGKRTYPDDTVHEGGFKDDKRHGHGKYTWADGTVYEGEYKDGEMHGQGKVTEADGKVLYELTFAGRVLHEGEFEDGQVALPEFVALKPGKYRGGRDHDYRTEKWVSVLLHTTTKGKVEVCKESKNIGGVPHFYVRIGDDMWVWVPAKKLSDYYACLACKKHTRKNCGRCGAKYCCRDCQAAHWSAHKERCKKRHKSKRRVVMSVVASVAAKGSWRKLKLK